jgi:hypothetical protein
MVAAVWFPGVLVPKGVRRGVGDARMQEESESAEKLARSECRIMKAIRMSTGDI